MILTGIENSEMGLEFMKAASVPMSAYDRDGIGYSAINSQNQLFMEKWHNNSKFLDTDTVLDSATIAALQPFKSRLPSLSTNYTSYGNVTRNDIKTVTMHTRMATCGKTFENTHPFIDQETSLIHNGVLTNAHELNLNKVSTCDSEVALQLYLNSNLSTTEKALTIQNGLLDKLKGYWAFGILAKNQDGDYILDVVREGASLYWCEIPEMGKNCTVFATTEAIIVSSLMVLGLPKREKIYALTESNLSRFNAITGALVADIPLAESSANFKVTSMYNKRVATKSSKENFRDYSDPYYYRDNDVYETVYSNNETETVNKVDDFDFQIDAFYDTNEPLLDRLFDYDELMSTDYGNCYENIAMPQRMSIEHMEENEYLTFDDILAIIEGHNATSLASTVSRMVKELKRA
jgi:glucosamine 6-phosphate synthetase-like amidotransferase/phosphosugar isomerase protein